MRVNIRRGLGVDLVLDFSFLVVHFWLVGQCLIISASFQVNKLSQTFLISLVLINTLLMTEPKISTWCSYFTAVLLLVALPRSWS